MSREDAMSSSAGREAKRDMCLKSLRESVSRTSKGANFGHVDDLLKNQVNILAS